jgi:SAM-dependent methyltransferase
MQDNSQQIEFWNGPGGERWAALNEMTERSLAFVTASLMPFAAAKSGERVLDVGCGCGSTTVVLARTVGAKGTVRGIDISRPMLEVARQRAKDASLPIDFTEADVSAHRFGREYDLVFSRFGVMFFADPAQAFANIRTGVADGGRMTFACWRSFGENTWAAGPFSAASDLLPPQPSVDPHAPGPFALADKDRLVSILEGAGFRSVRVEKLDTLMNMGATLDAAAFAALNIGPLARAIAELDEATRAKIQERVRRVLSDFETPAGFAPPGACWLVRAQA